MEQTKQSTDDVSQMEQVAFMKKFDGKSLFDMSEATIQSLQNDPAFKKFQEDHFDDITDAFQLCDKNADQTISEEELGTCIRAVGLNPTEEELKLYMKLMDYNKMKGIQMDEFVVLFYQIYKNEDELKNDLADAFKVFDMDRNSFITVTELEQILKNFGDRVPEEEAKRMIEAFDMNGDGQLDFKEFEKMAQKP